MHLRPQAIILKTIKLNIFKVKHIFNELRKHIFIQIAQVVISCNNLHIETYSLVSFCVFLKLSSKM